MARRQPSTSLSGVEAPRMAFAGGEFELAYRAYASRLRSVAFHVLRDHEAAEDAVHGALMRVWSSGAYRPERGPLLPFLIACVRRESLDQIRGARRRQARELRMAPDPIVPDPTTAIDPFEARRVRAALDALPESQRDVVLQAYYGQQTLAEIAQATGVPLGTVKSRLSQALRRLRTTLSGGLPN